MPSAADAILTFQAIDRVSDTIRSMASNTQSSIDGMNSSIVNGANGIADTYSSTFDQIGRGISTLNMGMRNLSSVSSMVMNELGSTKSAMEWVYGTTSKEDTNKVLIRNMGDTTMAWEDLYATIDKTTDTSLTSMQNLIPAMNAFRSATQASAIQLNDDVTADMANFGAFVLAQTGSEQLALTAMMDLSKGIKGQFSALDQYGVSLASLSATGKWKQDTSGSGKKWKGDEKDIKGYMDAVTEVVGGTEELMNTNEGLNAQMGKMWSRAGKRIGHEVMPGLKSLKQTFIDLDTEMNGDLSTAVLRVALMIEEANQKATEFNTLFMATQNIMEILRGAWNYLTVETTANTVAQGENNAMLAQNTAVLDANTQAKLANADATMAMNEMSYGSIVADAYPATAGTGYTSTDALTDMVLYGGGDVGFEAMQQLMARNSGVRNAGDNGLVDPDKFLPSYKPRPEWFSSEGMRGGKDILGISTPMGKIKPDSMADYNAYIESLYENIPKVDISNQRDYGRVLHDLTENTVIDDAQFDVAFNKLNGNIDDLNAYVKVKDRHESAIQALSEGREKLLSMPNADENEIKLLDRLIDEHTIQSARLDELLDSSDGFIPALERVVKKDADDKISLSRALANEEAEMALSEAIGLKWDNTRNAFNDKKTNISKTIKDKPRAMFDGLTDSLNSIKSGFTNFGKSAKEIENSADKGILQRLDYALFNPFRKTPPVDDAMEGVSKLAKNGEKVAQEAGAVVKGGEALAEGAAMAGPVGASMAEAEAGLSFMGLAEMGLAGAFTTLIVPTLAIAGVIAVLIPIIAGLAIEAMFFINIVGQMMEAMNFDSIDVDGAVEGLQSLAEAFAWLGVAMASLTFAGIMSSIGMLIAGGLALAGGFTLVTDMLIQIADEIRPLGELDIDPSIADNLSNLGNALNSISMAMLSLVGIQLTSLLAGIVTGFGLFGTIADSIQRAKSDIQQAVDAINDLNFTGIDENKVNQLKTTLDAIKSFADAFSSLAGMRTDEAISDFTAWLLDGGIFGNGGKSISEAITSAQKDIEEASSALSHFTNVSEIDQTTVDRLSKAGEAIKGMGDAFEGLRKIRDDKNWDAMFEDGGPLGFLSGKHDIASALDVAKDDIINISKSLKGLDGKLADIPDNVGERLQKVSETLASITGAIDALKKIDDAGGKKNKNFNQYVETIKTVREDLIKVSKEIKRLGGDDKGKGGLADITGTGIDEKIKAVTTTLTNIADSITALENISTSTNKGAKFDDYVSMIKSARKDLISISKEIKRLGGNSDGKGGLADITGTGIDTKIKAVTTTLTNIAESIAQLNTINATIGDGSKMNEYVTMIEQAKKGLINVSKHLKSLGSGGEGADPISSIPEDLAGKIKNVTTTLAEIAKAFVNLKNIHADNATQQEGGFRNYTTMIDNAKTALVNVSGKLKDLGNDKGLSDVDKGLPGRIKNITTTLTEVNGALSEMQSIFDSFGGSGDQPKNQGKTVNLNAGANIQQKGKGQGDVSNIQQYKTTVEKSATALKEVSGTLKKLGGEKGIQDVGDVSGKIKSVKSALTALSSSAKTMDKFPKINGQNVGFKVNRAVTGLKRASSGLKQLNEGDKVGGNITAIIDDIHNAVKKLKTALNGMDFSGEGKHIGSGIKTGISTGLGDLTSTVSGKISAVGPGVAGTAQSLGSTIAQSVRTGFETALDLVSVVSAQLQQAKLAADVGAAAIGTGSATDVTAEGDVTVSDTETSSTSGGIGDFVGVTRKMMNNIGNSGYNELNLNKFSQKRIDSLNEMNGESKMGNRGQNVNIIVGEGAVQLDARNLTTKESRQVMINALEGLDMIKGVRL